VLCAVYEAANRLWRTAHAFGSGDVILAIDVTAANGFALIIWQRSQAHMHRPNDLASGGRLAWRVRVVGYECRQLDETATVTLDPRPRGRSTTTTFLATRPADEVTQAVVSDRTQPGLQ
jgi:hypothetical protein